MRNYLPSILIAVLLALTIACNRAPAPSAAAAETPTDHRRTEIIDDLRSGTRTPAQVFFDRYADRIELSEEQKAQVIELAAGYKLEGMDEATIQRQGRALLRQIKLQILTEEQRKLIGKARKN